MVETYRDQSRSVSYLNFLDWRERSRAFQDVGARTGRSFTISGGRPVPKLSRARIGEFAGFSVASDQVILGRHGAFWNPSCFEVPHSDGGPAQKAVAQPVLFQNSA